VLIEHGAGVGRKWVQEWSSFGQIRRDRERDGLSRRALAERHGVHRRTVRAALESALPPFKRTPRRRPAPKLGAYRELIDEWLVADVQGAA
jgi:ribosome-binding protein aMBF1 (putative translation factor)